MSRYSDYKSARIELDKIEQKPEKYLIIHYSCESFYNLNGKTPKIASISVRKFSNGQTMNFSIHQFAEILSIKISDDNYKTVERELLTSFFSYVEKNYDKTWIHWNMRDNTFGFHAIEQRFKVLGGEPKIIDDDKKVDLAYLFKNLYGGSYIDNPRIEKLLLKNKLQPNRFLSGAQEAEAFNSAQYNELSMSTSSKVNTFSNFITLAINNQLITNVPKWKIRGTNIIGLYTTFTSTLFGKFLVWAINFVIGGIVGAMIAKYF